MVRPAGITMSCEGWKDQFQGRAQFPVVGFPGILTVVWALTSTVDRGRKYLDLLGEMSRVSQRFSGSPTGEVHSRRLLSKHHRERLRDVRVAGLNRRRVGS